MSVSITLALMELRDIYRKQAEDIIAASEPRLQAAKDEYHSAKIEHNRLQKLANNIELLITLALRGVFLLIRRARRALGRFCRNVRRRRLLRWSGSFGLERLCAFAKSIESCFRCVVAVRHASHHQNCA